jgi:hypothetical protein
MIARRWFGTAALLLSLTTHAAADYIYGRVTEVVDNHFFPLVLDSSRMSASTSPTRPSFGVTKHDCSSRFSASETWSMWISTQPATSERQSK